MGHGSAPFHCLRAGGSPTNEPISPCEFGGAQSNQSCVYLDELNPMLGLSGLGQGWFGHSRTSSTQVSALHGLCTHSGQSPWHQQMLCCRNVISCPQISGFGSGILCFKPGPVPWHSSKPWQSQHNSCLPVLSSKVKHPYMGYSHALLQPPCL